MIGQVSWQLPSVATLSFSYIPIYNEFDSHSLDYLYATF